MRALTFVLALPALLLQFVACGETNDDPAVGNGAGGSTGTDGATDTSSEDADVVDAGSDASDCGTSTFDSVPCVEADGAPCACAPGSHFTNGACRADCSLPCPVHAWCDDSSGLPVCVCAPGYTWDGVACDWTGVVKNSDFSGVQQAWATLGGAVIENSSEGLGNPGWARIPNDCATTSLISQHVALPLLRDGEPYALEVTVASNCTPYFFCDLAVDLILGDRFETRVTPGSSAATLSSCLGERQQGANLELALRQPMTSCTQTHDWYFDNVKISPSTECPRVGAVLNGDFEAEVGWTTESGFIESGIGICGSRRMRLATVNACDDADKLLGKVSIPISAVPNAAIRFRALDGIGDLVRLRIGPELDDAMLLDSRLLATADETVTACVPEWAKGVATDLQVAWIRKPDGTCIEQADYGPLLDDFQIVSDPTCPSDASVIDGGFEQGGRGWQLSSGSPSGASTVTIEATKDAAHSGAHGLRASLAEECGGVSASTFVTVPKAKGNAGPALVFHYRFDNGAPGSGFGFGFGLGSTEDLAPAAQYQQVVRCLDPRLSGHSRQLSFHASVDGACGSPIEPSTLYVDDVSVGTDPACPAK